MKKLSAISNVDLKELDALRCEIKWLIEKTYIHVSDNLPTELINMIDKFSASVDAEFNKRDL
jgi:hypothetical protein